MTINKYRRIDILILTVIATVCEAISYFFQTDLKGAGFYLSFSILLCLIGILRWGVYGCIIYPISGLLMVFTAQPERVLEKVLLYPLANSFIFLSILIFTQIDRNSVQYSVGKTIIFVIVSYVSVGIGKGFALLLLGQNPIDGMVIYFASELFNIIMVLLAMLLLRKKEGLMTDMPTYFLQQQQNDDK